MIACCRITTTGDSEICSVQKDRICCLQQECQNSVSIEVPVFDEFNEISGWRSITSPSELFSALIAGNIQHFAQAKGTPLVNGVFGSHLDPIEQNTFSDDILHSTVDLDAFDINEAIKACVMAMKYAPGEDGSNPVPSSHISINDFHAGFKAIVEQTSSSPSGRHIGHYNKAILPDDKLCKILATLTYLPFEFGFSLHQ
jgi:hypothetical protein